MELLSREAFRAAVFARDHGQCVLCHKPAVDAHHLYERKLWPDGGYYVEQGVALCEQHHWDAEATNISPTMLAKFARIAPPPMPPGLDPDKRYDKWGNQSLETNSDWEERKAGPLWSDDLAQLLRDRCIWHLLVQLPNDEWIYL
ncbi:MAG: HNH endonuclease [Ktedonobacterales bacterium]